MKSILKKYFAAVVAAALLISHEPILAAKAYDDARILVLADKYSTSKIYLGFELQSKKYISSIDSTSMIFKHVKTGAQLLYLKNSDKEMSFGIGFKTPASDNTGVNHIIEHSVLCGSEKYPVKSPFAQVRKQSLGTFINAMTFADFTLYPVASKNEKDLRNLMSVYLDAVFAPNLLKEPNIFKQEGWRYELDSKDSKLKLNGVVYNEMKGATSSPMRVLQNAVSESLFPDTSYRWNSGGNPSETPSLTFEKFLETYKKYYSPSNSYIFLYGDIDIESTLEFIDGNYLSRLKNEIAEIILKTQDPFYKKVEVISQYGVSGDGDTNNKTNMALSFVTGKTSDVEHDIAMSFLANLLMGLDSSPLKKALVENKIGQNVYCAYNNYGVQPILSIVVQNTDEVLKQKFEGIVRNTMETIVRDGFDKELIKALLNYYEISLKMSMQSTSRGIQNNILAMKGFIYGNNPILYLDSEGVTAELKKSIYNGYFEKMIKDCLLNNNHSSLIILKPVRSLEDKSAKELSERLQKHKASLGDKQIEALIRETKEFKNWQETPDSKESLLKIPGLLRSDIGQYEEESFTSGKEQDGIRLIFNNLPADGVSNVVLYFDASKVPQDKIQYLSLLMQILGKVDTKKYDYSRLPNEIIINTGGIGFTILPYNDYKNPDLYHPKATMSITALDDNLPSAFGIAEEVLNNSILKDKKRVAQILEGIKTSLESAYTSNPGMLASKGLMTHLTEVGRYSEEVSGLSFYKFISDMSNDIDSKWDDIVKNLEEVKKLAFNKEGLIIGYTGDESGYNKLSQSMGVLTDKISRNSTISYKYKFDSPIGKQAYALPVKTVDVLKGGNFKKLGYEYSGKMKVLQRILNSGYIWQQVRVRGGAYGGSISLADDGSIIFMSYRDPNLKQTLIAYDNVVEYLKNFDASDEEMTNYIIGTIGSMDLNLNPKAKGILSTMRFLRGVTKEDLDKEREEILSTSAQDIREYAVMIEKVLKQNIYTAAGDENIIKQNSDIFNEIRDVIAK